ncbi:putative nuclease HARBI1 [Homarus americanus]|uniref:Nuclease HARBI1-like 11 n=1 Tax=Homarus americanus TaxID=6706 RepID=A0A8J5JBT0_HOMAM|nr:putative nuclease HARBI1 [Homarus americanus]KAG7155056.1 nuclease HARBI1-like 11 [Homarus americanus]
MAHYLWALDAIDDIDRVRIPRRIVVDRRDYFQSMNDEEFLKNFHLSKWSVQEVLREIHLPLSNDRRGCPVPPVMQTLITLHWLATKNLQSSVAKMFDVSQSFVSSCISTTLQAIANLLELYIYFPGKEDLPVISEEFSSIANFPGVMGAINCTYIPLMKPSGLQLKKFWCMKGFYAYCVQAICGPNLKFFDLVPYCPGGFGKNRIFYNSNICKHLEENRCKYPGHLLGNSDYPNLPYLLTPLPNACNHSELKYNQSHAETKRCIQKAFVMWKRRFRRLTVPFKTNLDTVVKSICVTAVLHNIAIQHQDPLPASDDIHEEEENGNVEDVNEKARLILEGRLKRSDIIQHTF